METHFIKHFQIVRHDLELFVVYSGHEMKSLMVVTEEQKYQQTLTIQA